MVLLSSDKSSFVFPLNYLYTEAIYKYSDRNLSRDSYLVRTRTPSTPSSPSIPVRLQTAYRDEGATRLLFEK